jgi:hypothetical protein
LISRAPYSAATSGVRSLALPCRMWQGDLRALGRRSCRWSSGRGSFPRRTDVLSPAKLRRASQHRDRRQAAAGQTPHMQGKDRRRHACRACPLARGSPPALTRGHAAGRPGSGFLVLRRSQRVPFHCSASVSVSAWPTAMQLPGLDEAVKQHVAAPGDEQHDGLKRWCSGQSEAEDPGGARGSGAAPGCDGAAEVSWHAAACPKRTGEADRRARECEQGAVPQFPASCQERPGRPVAYPQVTGQSPAQRAENRSRGGRREGARILKPGRIGAKSKRPGPHAGSFRGGIDADREGL